MNNISSKKTLLYSILALFLLGLFITSGTYAYFTWRSDTNKVVNFNTAKGLQEYIVYDEGESKFIGDFQVSNTFNQGIHSTITLNKKSEAANVDLIATINMDVNSIGNEMKKSSALKWVVTAGTSSNVGNVLARGNFIGVNSGDTLILVPGLEVTTTPTSYTIWIWLDASENPSDLLSGEALDTVVWTQIDQVEGVEEQFEITRIDANYQNISATVVSNKAKVTHYAVTTTNTAPSSWTSIDSTDQSNVYNLNYTVSQTGTYYVWFKNADNKTTSRSVTVDEIDTTAPTCTFGNWSTSPIQNNGTATIQLTCTDAESTITINNLTTASLTKSNNNINITNITKTAVTNGYGYVITVTGTETDGLTKITLPANTIKNAMALGNTLVESSNIEVANVYTVKFNSNNNDCTLNATTYADYTATYGTVFNKTNPTCTGYTFTGWTANSGLDTTNAKYGNSSSAVTTTWSNASTLVTATWFNNLAKRDVKTVTLTANWSPNDDTDYLVRYYFRELGGETYTSDTGSSEMGTTGETLVLADLAESFPGFTYIEGYAYDGENANGNQIKPSSGAVTTTTILPSGNRVIVLYYRRNNLYIQYDMNNGSMASNHGASYGISGSLVTNTSNNPSTNFFSGVYGGKVGDVNTTTLAASNGLQDYNNNSGMNIIKTGYAGLSSGQWNTKANGTGTSYSQTSTTIDANDLATACGANLRNGDVVVKLYVNWKPVNYTISYNLDGGTVSLLNPTIYTIESNAITLYNPTKAGYTFTGWTGSNGSTLQTTVTIPTGSTGNKAYTAHYTANSYQVKYNDNCNLTASGTMANSSHTYDESKALTTNAYSCEATVTYNYHDATGGNSTANSTSSKTFLGWTVGGPNLIDLSDFSNTDNITINSDGTLSFNVNNSSGSSNKYANFFSRKRDDVTTSTDYVHITDVKSKSVSSGTINYNISSTQSSSYSQIYNNQTTVNALSLGLNHRNTTSRSSFSSTSWLARAFITIPAGSSVSMRFRPILVQGTYNNVALYYTNEASVMNLGTTGTVNVYADWTQQTSVTLPTPTKTGYSFKGWYTAAIDGTKIGNGGASYKPTSDVTLHAQWTANSLTFNNQTLTSGTYGTAYTSNAFAAATNGTGSYTYTIGSSTATGATINSTNRIITLPTTTAAGSYTVTVHVVDNNSGAETDADMTIVINPKSISLGNYNDTYNGATTYSRTFSTGVGTETLTLTYKPYVKTAAAYTYATSAASGKYTVTAANGTGTASNYSISGGGTFTITAKSLTPTVSSCTDKTYDGGTSASCTITLATVETGDTVTASGTCTFDNKNVGTNHTVTCSSITLSGADAGNYSLSATSKTKTGVKITAKSITITAKNQSITYGGSIATGTGQVTVATLATGDSLTAITLTPSTSDYTTNGTITPSAATIKDNSGSGNDVTSNYSITYNTGTLSIGKKSLTPTVSSCTDRTYDGGTSASCTITVATVETGDTVTASGTCTFDNKNVGTNHTVTCSSITLGGADAGNYSLSATSKTKTGVKITAKGITITAKNQSITYGGSIATGTGQVTVATLATGDSLTAITLTPSTNDYTTSGTITPSAATIKDNSGSGTDVTSNYSITYTAGTLSIGKKSLTPTVSSCGTSNSKTYDGTTSASCTITLATVETGDTVTASGTCTYDNKNVGTNHTVTCSSITLGGTNAGNYSLSTTSATKTGVKITAKSITITAKNQSITYGGSIATGTGQVTVATLATGDSLTAITLTPSTNDYTTSGTITPSAATIKDNSGSGNDVTSNYSITYTAGTLSIGKKSLTPTVSSCTDRAYNGGTSASCTIMLATVETGDTVSASGTCTFDNKNVGTNHTVTCSSITLSGADAGNYSLSATSKTKTGVKITAEAITITAKNQSITYGGSIATGTSQVTVATLASGDSLTAISLAASTSDYTTNGTITPSAATIKDSNGSGTDVTSNYSITYTAGTLSIGKKSLTPTVSSCGTSNSKTYDGTTSASCTITLATVETGDTVTASGTCTYDNKNVGTTHTITCSSITLGGASAGNYSLSATSKTLTNAKITARAITIKAKDQSITYGGSIATGTGQITISSGSLGTGDAISAVTLTPSTSNYTTSGTITPSNTTIKDSNGSGNSMNSNYTISYANGTLSIGKKSLTPTVSSCGTSNSKTYDGTTSASCTITLATVETGDTVTASGTCTYDNKNVGTTHTITCSSITLSGASAGNYSLSATSKTLTNAKITARAITIKANDQSITYGGSIATGTGQVTISSGSLGTGDAISAVTLTPSTSDYTTNGTITPSAATIKDSNGSGNDVTSNYSITYTAGTLLIGKKSLTITAKNQTITYGESITNSTDQVTTATLATGDSLTAITLTPSTSNYTTSGTITPSAVTIKKGSTDVTSNYNISYVNGTLIINKKALTSTELTSFFIEIENGATSYTRAGVSTGVGNETITLVYTPYANVVGNYTYSTTAGAGKYTLAMSPVNNNYSISSSGTIALIDTALPEGELTTDYSSNTITATVTVTDDGSGPSGNYGWKVSTESTCNELTEGFTDTTSNTYNFNITQSGIHYVCVRISDNAGNEAYISKISEASYIDYEYLGDYQTFTAPESGYYKVETWGAQGGNASTALGGKGSYSMGYINLSANDNLYVYVGGTGGSTASGVASTVAGGYNGGGATGGQNCCNRVFGSGGGSTDIRLVSGTWNDATSLNSRIMVAAGGGGAFAGNNEVVMSNAGGNGGTLIGNNGVQGGTGESQTWCYGEGATQTSGGKITTNCTQSADVEGGTVTGSFGKAGGGNGAAAPGGGGGYYGGSRAGHIAAAGGGSSFISGYAGVNAITSASDQTHTNNTKHYSNKYFINDKMTAGVNTGNGRAKITYVGSISERVNTDLNGVRYIKDCIAGSNHDATNSWEELQAIERNTGINVAKGKAVTSTGTVQTGNYSLGALVDGKIIHNNDDVYLNETGFQCVTVDLGSTYDLDEIAVWHYYSDGTRTYNYNTTYVSDNAQLWMPVMSRTEVETYNGKRVTAWDQPLDNYEPRAVFYYTGDTQSFTAPVSGYYKVETWGARGGYGSNNTYSGGNGGYSSGYINLSANDTLYVYVGGNGSDSTSMTTNTMPGGWNGGGNSIGTTSKYVGSGGGATDIRLVSGTWNDATSLNSRIMVAGGGGAGGYESASYSSTGGLGGGLIGKDGTTTYTEFEVGTGGTQIAGGGSYITGSFGQGANSAGDSIGGGGGYYGGGAGKYTSGSGGGSGFISGYAGVNAITSANDRTHTNNTRHYSNKYFIKGTMTSGSDSLAGKARIIYVGDAPTRINTSMNGVRYIKDCINGNNSDNINRWSEIQAVKNGVNLAYGLTATVNGGTLTHAEYITDGIVGSYQGQSDGYTDYGRCVTIDLGSAYDLDEVAVWHLYLPGKTYYDNVTYVSDNGQLWIPVMNRTEEETANGKRVTAWDQPLSDNTPRADFYYTGDSQSFTVPVSGYYKIETWGAQGAGGGKGAYTYGYINLTANDNYYVYVGLGNATTGNTKIFNGGTSDHGGWNGGGATDIRLVNGDWDNSTSLNSRIMVAGGGGSNNGGIAGFGGGLVGGAGGGTNGGTQISAGARQADSYAESSFGIANGGCTGGNGYYAGGGATCAYGAGGGSSFISGYAGVNAITSASNRTHANSTLHYSGQYFINDRMFVDSNRGNGRAKITYIGTAPARINENLDNVRYIKDCISGNSTNNGNHWVELQAIKDGVNIAKGKTVTGTGAVSTQYGTGDYSTIVNGDIGSDYVGSTDSGNQCITIDLGNTYDLDEIAVWHYWADGRAYYNNVTYVSSNNSTWTPAISYLKAESSEGKRISAYYIDDNQSFSLLINPNGGTYNSKSAVSTVTKNTGDAYGLLTPIKSGNTFYGWEKNTGGGSLYRGNTTGDPAAYSTQFTKTEKTDSDGSKFTNFKFTNYSATTVTYPNISYPHYSFTAGHTYRISVDIRLNTWTNLAYFQMRHAAGTNDYSSTGRVAYGFNSSLVGKGWDRYTMERTWTGTTIASLNGNSNVAINPLFELFVAVSENTTASLDFDIRNIVIEDITNSTQIATDTYGGYVYVFGSGSETISANWNVNNYYLDVNGYLDGASSGNISGFGTFDVYVNGSQVANDVTDYYAQHPYGSTYSISDIKTASGKRYDGVYSGSLSGTISGTTSVYLQYTSLVSLSFSYTGYFKTADNSTVRTGSYSTSSSSYVVWFTSGGTLTMNTANSVSVFLVGAGNNGTYRGLGGNSRTYGGNGGAGGKTYTGSISLSKNGSYSISIGNTNGANSTFSSLSSASGSSRAGGTGAACYCDASTMYVESSATAGTNGVYAFGNSSIDGILYGAGGGGAGCWSCNKDAIGASGGSSGGGHGGSASGSGSAGAANTGGGGGGRGSYNWYDDENNTGSVGAGGSGIVIMKNN